MKKLFLKFFKSHKTFNFCFLGPVILHKLSTTTSSDQHNFGFMRHRNINDISYETRFTFFLNNIINQHLISLKNPGVDM